MNSKVVGRITYILIFLLSFYLVSIQIAQGSSFDSIHTISSVLPIQVPVLTLTYYPPDPANPAYLDPVETGWTNMPITTMQIATAEMITAGQALINEATRYHGYTDSAAPMYLEYSTYESLEYFRAMPRGHHLGGTEYRPNYGQILRDIDICDYVDVHLVKEVWIYGYHSTLIVPDESKMSSKYGDISNAFPKDEYVLAAFRLPRCENSYVLYNFTYQPGGAEAIGNTIHNRLHQIENVIFFAEDRGYPPNDLNVVGSIFWDDFSVYGNRAMLSGYRASCGNTHSPPNTTKGYDYDSPEYRLNNCETWHPDDAQTTYVTNNCTQWGCTDLGFYTWFMQNLPGYDNDIVFNGKVMRNWWEAMVNFNAFIEQVHSLWLDEEEGNQKIFLPVVIGPNLKVTNLVSVALDGRAGNGKSFGADVSGDGRYVGFTSAASDLVPNDTNATEDVFVRDLLTGATTRVSIASDGAQGRYESFYPSLSADGRFVAFQSAADNLVPGEGYYDWDIFVHDRLTGVTEIVSVSNSGEHGNSDSLFPEITADGRFVVFTSHASNLDGPNDDNLTQAFVHDRLLKTTARIMDISNHLAYVTLSGDGRYIAFTSFASDLVPGDTNGVEDVFVYDRLTSQIERASVSSAGVQADRPSYSPSISYDGRYLSFNSRATTLGDDDEDSYYFDMFVRDRATGETTRVTKKDDGSDFSSTSLQTSGISGDGRIIFFDQSYEIYIRDWQHNRTEYVSVSSTGEPANPGCTFPSISTDGRVIAFECRAENLDLNDLNDEWDIYVHILTTQ